jgi:hypothetical protein
MAAEWKTVIKVNEDVRAFERAHKAGADSNWLVSKVMFKGLFSDVNKDAAVPSNLDDD